MKSIKAITVTLSIALGCLQANAEQDLEQVTASWLPIMQTTAYYVALEEGLFEKAGIEINSVRFGNPNQIIDSLVSGQADFGPPGAAAGIAMLAEARFPGTFKVFGLQGGSIELGLINDGLIVANDSDIQSFEDLKGKTIGTVPGTMADDRTSYRPLEWPGPRRRYTSYRDQRSPAGTCCRIRKCGCHTIA